MLRTVVLFFVVCAIGAVTLLLTKVISAKKRGQDSEKAGNEQNLHTRYSFGEFSHDEYQVRLTQLRSPSSVQ